MPNSGLVDACIEYPSELGSFLRTIEFFKLLVKLRSQKFDAVVYLMNRVRSAAQIDRDLRFFAAAGIKRVIGADYMRNHRLPFEITKPVPAIRRESEFLLDLIASEGFPVEGFEAYSDLGLTDKEMKLAREIFDSQTTDKKEGSHILAVAPGSKWPSKVWAEEAFAAVVDRLIADNDCYPVIFGGREDRDKGDRLLAQWKTGTNLAGHLSVRESAALLKTCDLYLGNDTGTMHLAGAVGTPCVAIYAAVDWKERYVPFGRQNTILRRTVECEGCITPDCFNDNKCLRLITVDEVYAACSEKLGNAD